MSRTVGIVLIIWNVLLSALVGRVLLRTNDHTTAGKATPDSTVTSMAAMPSRDSSALSEARIAYFFMDSLRSSLDLLKDRQEHYRKEGQRLQNNWQKELGKAEARFQELMNKDHTYSTQAQIKADEKELGDLRERITGLKEESEEQLSRLENDILREISKEVEGFLKAYNEKAGFDYIISVEPGGQIWVGNPDLNITAEVRDGLNAQYHARLEAAGKK